MTAEDETTEEELRDGSTIFLRPVRPEDKGAIAAGFARMEAAERGEDDPLDADIAFHVAVVGASGNPFYVQFKDVVATALRTSIRFTNRFANRTADLPAHAAVLHAIRAGDGAGAAASMGAIIGGVRGLIDEAKRAG